MLVGDRAQVGRFAVAAAFRRGAAAAPPELDGGDLRHLLDVHQRPEHRMVEGQVADGVLGRRQHAADLRLPVLPRGGAPEVVDPEEPALEQVVPELGDLRAAQPDGARVGGHDERAVEQLAVGERHHPVVRLAPPVEAHLGRRQVREPEHQVDARVRVVGDPAHAERLVADAAVHQLAEREVAVRHRGRGVAGGHVALAEEPLGPRARRERGRQPDREQQGDSRRETAPRESHLRSSAVCVPPSPGRSPRGPARPLYHGPAPPGVRRPRGRAVTGRPIRRRPRAPPPRKRCRLPPEAAMQQRFRVPGNRTESSRPARRRGGGGARGLRSGPRPS